MGNNITNLVVGQAKLDLTLGLMISLNQKDIIKILDQRLEKN